MQSFLNQAINLSIQSTFFNGKQTQPNKYKVSKRKRIIKNKKIKKEERAMVGLALELRKS